MARFHILYRKENDYVASALNVEANDPIQAYGYFLQQTVSTDVFIGLYNLETVSVLIAHQLEQAHKFPTPELFINASSQPSLEQGEEPRLLE